MLCRHFVHRLCVNIHRLCVKTRAGYTVYAQTGTPFMRGKLAGFTPVCGFRWRTAATADRHRGESCLSSPATPPDKRVRIRRFDELIPCQQCTEAGGSENAPPMVVSPLVEFHCRLHPLPTRSSSARKLIGWRMATHETRFPTAPSHRSGLRPSRNYYALC